MVAPLVKHNQIKKRKKPFIRHQADRFLRVPNKWRKPKGIDSRVRRRFRDTVNMANIGYGTNKRYRHTLPNGFKKVTVYNEKDVDMLLMHNRVYAAEVAHAVSSQKRKLILQRAQQLNVKVLNAQAKMRTEEHE